MSFANFGRQKLPSGDSEEEDGPKVSGNGDPKNDEEAGEKTVSVDLGFRELIVNLTSSKVDSKFIQDIFLTYHSICTSAELLAAMTSRFLETASPSYQHVERETICDSVIRFLIVWITDFSYLSQPLPLCSFSLGGLLTDSYDFAEVRSQVRSAVATFLAQVSELDVFNQQLAGVRILWCWPSPSHYCQVSKFHDIVFSFVESDPPTEGATIHSVPKSDQADSLLDLDPAEFAAQLTAMDEDCLLELRPREFVDVAWKRSDSTTSALSVLATSSASHFVSENLRARDLVKFLDRYSAVRGMVLAPILLQSSKEKRFKLIKYFVKVAKHLRAFLNFSSLMAVLEALEAPAIKLIPKGLQALSKANLRIYEAQHDLFVLSPEQLCLEMAKAPPTAIPYVPAYLARLESIEEQHLYSSFA